LPPGAFFGLALLIVVKNWLEQRPAAQPLQAAVDNA
jgi:Na+-translocating ferredoxin:NAD+ oxidoreductase RnfE subunit